MVKVLKKDKSLEGFRAAKVVRACKKAGMPAPIAETIAKMVSRKIARNKVVKSGQIRKIVFDIIAKVSKVPKNWMKYKKPKKKR